MKTYLFGVLLAAVVYLQSLSVVQSELFGKTVYFYSYL